MKRIFISGPLTVGDQMMNIRNAIDVAEIVINGKHCPVVPHYSSYHNMIHQHSYDDWMNICYCMLEGSDVMFRINGKSYGADLEEKFANKHGIPIFYEIEKLIKYLEEC